MRTEISLNFDWKYSENYTDEMIKKSYDDSNFQSVDIPHCNKEIPYNYFDEKMYQFVSCYRKHFTLPDTAYEKGKRTFIHFEGAASYSVVYINGKKAGEHKGGYTPFSFDITELICKKDNVVTVKLDSTERSEIPPFGNMVDYLVYGGIYREVGIEIVDEVRIEDVFVRTPEVLDIRKTLIADIKLSQKSSGKLHIDLLKDDSVISSKECSADGTQVRIKWKIKNVEPWTLENPVLYRLRVRFADDEVLVRFGFRTAEFTRTGFKLNGKKIKLSGLNRHQSYPYVGYAMPESVQKADADLLKYKLGCNIVRTSHYPDSVHFLNRCDEIGLLVFTEMPSWQYLGEGEWRENCLDNIEKMVIRDRNHPSVILWGVRVNEGTDCDEFYTETNRLARSLDGSRQTGGVRNMPRSHLLEDVYTYNDFSHTGGKISLLPPAIVTGFTHPYLVTENNGHMYPTKSFDREEIRTEHALRHARVQNAAQGNKRISGAIDWCMADYNTHKDFGSGDKICYHGVTDMFRIPKLAAAVFASQQDDIPVMEVSSDMNIGEYPGGIMGKSYIFTNCDYVKLYKNGEFKSIVFPEKNLFPHLKHPPIIPVDFIGDSLEKDDGLDPVTAKYLKKALVAASQDGFILPPHHYLELAFSFLHGRMKINDFINLITKYFANWGDEQTEYKFEGFKDGELVKTVVKTAVTSTAIEVSADSTELCENKTYDATRIEILCTDQNGNKLPFCNDTITVKTNDVLKVIGPDTFSLIGGVRAFWVRTTGKSGTGKITVKCENGSQKTVEITVIKV